MKRVIKSSKSSSFDPVENGWYRDSLLEPSELEDDPGVSTFKVYFKDGNKKTFDAENIYDVLSHVLFVDRGYNASDIWKIEEI